MDAARRDDPRSARWGPEAHRTEPGATGSMWLNGGTGLCPVRIRLRGGRHAHAVCHDRLTANAAPTMIDPKRIQPLNSKEPARGAYILYWMQQSQRAEFNHALEYAIQRANDLRQGGARRLRPDRTTTRRQTCATTASCSRACARRPRRCASAASDGGSARPAGRGGPGAGRRTPRSSSATAATCGTRRRGGGGGAQPRIARSCRSSPISSCRSTSPRARSNRRPHHPAEAPQALGSLPEAAAAGAPREAFASRRAVDASRPRRPRRRAREHEDRPRRPAGQQFFRGGARAARALLRAFLAKRLARYDDNRNQPQTDDVSHHEPLPALRPDLAARDRPRGARAGAPRRARAFPRGAASCAASWRTTSSTSPTTTTRYDCLPDWARRTLAEHARDARSPSLFDAGSSRTPRRTTRTGTPPCAR